MGEFCRSHGHSCNYPDRCCGDNCCTPKDYDHQHTPLRFNIWNMWYFWFAVLFTLMTCLGACGYWRRSRLFFAQEQFVQNRMGCQYRTNQLTTGPNRRPLLHQLVRLYPTRPSFRVQLMEDPVNSTERETVQGTFPSPPPYSEVISKPGEYAEMADKDDLPPYPGLPMNTDTTFAMGAMPAETVHMTPQVGSVHMSGLPPYTESPPSQMDTSQGDAAHEQIQTVTR